MNDQQYWQWFWLHMKWSLIIGGPIFLALLVWAGIQYWYEDTQEDKPEEHFTKLFRRKP